MDQQILRLGYSREISRPYRDGIDIPAVGAFLFLGVLLALGGSLIYSFIPLGLFSFARTVGIIIIVGTVVVALISAASKSSDNDRRQTEYQQAVQQDKTRVRKELQQRSDLESKRPEYVDRLEQAKQIRDKSYRINIIPQQMRNIYAVYYLYNYLSTSQSSLESAMLHFDLNEIKSKLDTMILQQQIILQQAQQIAQNERIIAPNEEIIDHAIATEHNIERGAQYAEVAAANSEVTAFTNTVMASITLLRYDPHAACHWWTEAAKAGNVVSMYNPGILYMGDVSKQFYDDKQAVYWLTEASNRGYQDAWDALNENYKWSNFFQKWSRR